MKDNRLKQYVISSHVDKPLGEKQIHSVYDVPIQAGAALTDLRVCELNDHDGFPESISDRNRRYSEGTAMWWIAKHIDTPYVGITHYRRRLALTDEQLSDYMDAGVDVITSELLDLGTSIEENYGKVLYPADWKLFQEILREYAPGDADFAEKCFASHEIHPCNVNVFKADLYREYSDWAFPMLDAFYRRSPLKTDRYQIRDVGFIAERLSHLFVMKLLQQGKKVVETDIINLKSGDWTVESENCDLEDPQQVFELIDQLYRENWIGRCCTVLQKARKQNALDERLQLLDVILGLGQIERSCYPMTMHEYLPAELRADLSALAQTYEGFRKAVRLYAAQKGETAGMLLRGYEQLTHFSGVVIAGICRLDELSEEDTDAVKAAAFAE
jgi:hypothetical protein